MNTNYGHIWTRLMLLVYKVFGLAPFAVQPSPLLKLTKTGNSRNFAPIRFAPSRIGFLYNFLLITVQLYLLCVALPHAYSDEYPNKSALTVTLDVSASVIGNLALLAIYLIHAFRQKTTARLLNRLYSVNVAFFKNNIVKNCSSSPTFFILATLTNVVVWIGLYTTMSISYQLSWVSSFRLDFPSMIIAWFVTQYVFVIKLIYDRLKLVNRVILDNSASSPVDREAPGFSVVSELSFGYCATSRINTVRSVHANLYEIARDVSRFYSLPILLAIAHLCYIFIYNTYYLTIPLVVMIDKYSGAIVANVILWITASMLPIVMLASKITDFNAELKRTADIVNELLIQRQLNEFDRAEMKQFALELMHRKVRFAACGLFLLDYTLVHSILSMATTYLIILVQHQMGRSTKIRPHEIPNGTKIKSYSTGYNGV